MHTLSTRTLSALAYDRGEEYDPSCRRSLRGKRILRAGAGHIRRALTRAAVRLGDPCRRQRIACVLSRT